MSRQRFSVLRVGDGWRIVGRGRASGFETCELAALATARLVAQAIHDGYQVELVMEKKPHARRPAACPANAEVVQAHASYRRTDGPFAAAVDRAAARAEDRMSFTPALA